MELEHSLPCSQKPAAGPQPKPGDLSSHTFFLIFSDPILHHPPQLQQKLVN
jgi:hypothetical protein